VQQKRTPVAVLPYTSLNTVEPTIDQFDDHEDMGLQCLHIRGNEHEPMSEPCTVKQVICEPPMSTPTVQQQDELQELLQRHQSIFSKGKDDIGIATLDHPVYHRITVKPGSEPAKTNRPIASYSRTERDFLRTEA
jgi:hypothetical protein